jgi:hypothetical protein
MQTFVPEQQIDSNGEPAMVQPASDLKPGRILHSKNWPEVLMDRKPKNLSEEFDPGSE